MNPPDNHDEIKPAEPSSDVPTKAGSSDLERVIISQNGGNTLINSPIPLSSYADIHSARSGDGGGSSIEDSPYACLQVVCAMFCLMNSW